MRGQIVATRVRFRFNDHASHATMDQDLAEQFA
jgi:hypothetical protein